MMMWEEIDVIEDGRISLEVILEWGKKYPCSSADLIERRRRLGLF